MDQPKSTLHFQRLDVYQCAIELVAHAEEIIEALPRGNSKIVDQLQRASSSIPLNIAEGCGKRTKRDKQNYFSIARGSAMECAAALDVLLIRKLVEPSAYQKGIELLDRLNAMLSRMSQ